MTAQKGRDLLLKLHDGTDFVTVAGLRARRIAFNTQPVDTSDSQSAGRWRELLAGAGLKRASVSGGGIFRDAASDELVRQAFFDATAPAWQVVIPDFGTLEGPFQVVALEYAGQHDGELTFQMTLESAGALGFEAS
ncbi:MAG: phage major tail protein, TP901-1 family [Pseudomonadota bacterium]|nr:phage major tail protein, TP901-1 family [Pseudomonadota bacterium]